MSIAQVEIDRYLRIVGKEFRQQWRDVQHSKRHRYGKAAPGPARHRRLGQCGRPSAAFALGEEGMCAARPASCRPASVKAKTPRCAVDEPRAQPRLYPADKLWKNGRLGKPLAPPPVPAKMSESQRPWRRSLALRGLVVWPWFKFGNDEFP